MRKKIRYILLALCIVGLLSSFWAFPKRSFGSENTTQNGIYTVQGELDQAFSNQISMADSAVKRPMYVIKKEESTYLRLELEPVGMGLLSGYLYEISYYPDWDKTDELPDSEKTQEKPVQVETYSYRLWSI